MHFKAGLIFFAVIGFLFTSFGIEAEEVSIKKMITFGNKTSPIEVYFFSDWSCPACRKIEPTMLKMVPAIMQDAQFTFVDYTMNPESLNFTPFNLSLMMFNQDRYIKLREVINGIALRTIEPTEDEITKAVEPLGVKFHELQYSQVMAGIHYFEKLGKNFKVNSTPTVVIYNASTKKDKKLHGDSEITEENVLKAIKQEVSR